MNTNNCPTSNTFNTVLYSATSRRGTENHGMCKAIVETETLVKRSGGDTSQELKAMKIFMTNVGHNTIYIHIFIKSQKS